MRIVVAMDSFKGSLGSMEAGEAVIEGIRNALPSASVALHPLADGGEGTAYIITEALGGKVVSLTVTGPLGEPTQAEYGILPHGIAIMEIASAAGLTLIPRERRNPMHTTTYGVGEMILDAYNRGCRSFMIGLGGSATNDGGMGMLSALGWKFQDKNRDPVAATAEGLQDLDKILPSPIEKTLTACSFRVACDVNNPLLGQDGCSAVFAPQKGAKDEDILRMDQWLGHYAALTGKLYPHVDPALRGGGAAGGLGYAFVSYLQASLEPGAELIASLSGLEENIRRADLIITGEGSLDRQSAMGKGPGYVAALGKKYGKKVLALAGRIGSGAEACHDVGITAYFPIHPSPMSIDEAMNPQTTYRDLKNTAQQLLQALL